MTKKEYGNPLVRGTLEAIAIKSGDRDVNRWELSQEAQEEIKRLHDKNAVNIVNGRRDWYG